MNSDQNTDCMKHFKVISSNLYNRSVFKKLQLANEKTACFTCSHLYHEKITVEMTEEIAKLTSFWVIKSLAIEKLSKLIKTHLPTYSTVYSEDKNNITIQPSHIKTLTLNGKRNKDVFENCNHEPSDVLQDNSFSMFV